MGQLGVADVLAEGPGGVLRTVVAVDQRAGCRSTSIDSHAEDGGRLVVPKRLCTRQAAEEVDVDGVPTVVPAANRSD